MRNNVTNIHTKVKELQRLADSIYADFVVIEKDFELQQANSIQKTLSAFSSYLFTLMVVIAVISLIIMIISSITAKNILSSIQTLQRAAHTLVQGEGDRIECISDSTGRPILSSSDTGWYDRCYKYSRVTDYL